MRRVAFATIVALVLGASPWVATTTPATSPTVLVRTASAPEACVYVRHSLRRMAAAERLLGRRLDCAVLFNDAAETWDDLESPWFTDHVDPDYDWPGWVAARPGRTVVIGQGLVPSRIGGDWRAKGAAGAYDVHFRRLAASLVRHGMGRAVIRLGHEGNGTWGHDHAGDTARDQRAWARYWARVTHVMDAVPGARFTFDWSVNAGYRPIPFARWYPGDAAVDVVGIDQYDTEPRGERRVRARWQAIATQRGGLRAVLAFAAAHGKPVSFPEWGLVSASKPDGAGDNPHYVARMARLFRIAPVRYQGLWLSRSGTGIDLRDAPRSLRVYRNQVSG